jgi:hypothetical protein
LTIYCAPPDGSESLAEIATMRLSSQSAFRWLTEQTAGCESCRDELRSRQEHTNELRHFTTSSNFCGAACVPFRQRDRERQAEDQRRQRALGDPTVAVVFTGGLLEHDDRDPLGQDRLAGASRPKPNQASLGLRLRTSRDETAPSSWSFSSVMGNARKL